jgi:hypothetical protein
LQTRNHNVQSYLDRDISISWAGGVAGYKPGFWKKILASNIDETNKTGSRSRLLRIGPRVFSEKPFLHDHWVDVYLSDGDLIVGNDSNGNGGEQFVAPMYACRPPGVAHGPFKSEKGCLLFELHYYFPDTDGKLA